MGLPVDRVKFATDLQSGVFAGLAGVLLLGLIFNGLNFGNGAGWISRSAC